MAIVSALGKYTLLPKEITDFEYNYLKRLNKIALVFFYCHIPVFMLVAWAANTGPLMAFALSMAVLIGPTIAYKYLPGVRSISVVYGITAMFMGGLLVHFGQGPVQIEMHFYFFALLAMLCMFSNPMVNIAAAITVALHHLILWYLLPSSVFNYDAPFWVVAVHAAFVVLETCAACFISRQFFDNVIGLEKIVQQRTVELHQKQRDMRLILDNINQGFITISATGKMSSEMSSMVQSWFGQVPDNRLFSDYVRQHDGNYSDWFELGLDSLRDGFLPVEVSLSQLPKKIKLKEHVFSVSYQLIDQAEAQKQDVTEELEFTGNLLIMISDITEQLKREKEEVKQKQQMSIFEHIVNDKVNFLEFMQECTKYIDTISSKNYLDLSELKRLLHTLKGNASLFGLNTIVDLSHELEDWIVSENSAPSENRLEALVQEWANTQDQIRQFIGEMKQSNIEILRTDYDEVLDALSSHDNIDKILTLVKSWQLESMDKRIEFIKQQIMALARRVGKPDTEVKIDIVGEGIRFSSGHWRFFWSTFSHLIRNALDHGIESSDERQQSGKHEKGRIELSVNVSNGQFIVSIADNGRGIDWDKISECAHNLHISEDEESGPQDFIYLDGVTTKQCVTELSGRGVGMGAVKAACLELGGSIKIESTLGEGSRFTFIFPVDETIYYKVS